MKHEGKLFKVLYKARGFTQDTLAKKLGVSRQTIVDWQDMSHLPTKRKEELESLLKVKFEQASTDPVKYILENPSKIKSVVEDAHQAFMRPAKPIPFFDIDVAASNIEMFDDKGELPTMSLSIPGFEDCSFAVPVWGDSMYPTYKNGFIVMCKKLTDYDIIQYGEPHLIITKEQRFVKRILKGETKDVVICASDNSEAIKDGKRRYENFELKKNKIRHLYIIKGAINRSQL